MTYAPGDRAIGRQLRDFRPVYVTLTGDVYTSANDVLTDVPNLAIPVQARTRYAMDGYLAYSSNSTADIKFAMLAPGNTAGHWGLFPVAQGAGSSSGDLEGFRLDTFGDAQGAAGSASEMFCTPHGYFRCGDIPGALRIQFAQITSDAGITILRAGSWLRLVQLPD